MPGERRGNQNRRENKNGKEEEKRRKMRKKEKEERERKEEKEGVSRGEQTRNYATRGSFLLLRCISRLGAV